MVDWAVLISSTDKASRPEDEVFAEYPVWTLVDPGTGRSQLDINVIHSFGIADLGDVDVFTASTGNDPEVMLRFLVNVSVAGNRHGLLARDREVVGSEKLGGLNVPMLLGRDVLNRCLLSSDGPNRRCSLAYDTPWPL